MKECLGISVRPYATEEIWVNPDPALKDRAKFLPTYASQFTSDHAAGSL